MKPSDKSPKMVETLETLSERLFGRSRVISIESNTCVTCGDSVKEDSFKDSVSAKEFQISGLCQKCQDSFFG